MFAIRPVQALEDVPRLSDGPPGNSTINPGTWLQPGSIGLVAKSDTGDTVGAILLVPDKWLLAKVMSLRVVYLCVDEVHRRKGIARSLLKAAAKKAAQDGIQCMHVSIRPSNAAAVALFDSLSLTGGAGYVINLSHGGL